MEVRVGGKYRVGRKIGSGSFGDIHHGSNVQTGEEVAIKLESTRAGFPQLIYESKLYKLIGGGGHGVPSVHWYGTEGDYNVMVIDLLGPSLEDLFEFTGYSFGLKTTLMLADQMITRIEYVHAKNFIHRDIKPENFCIGLGKVSHMVHIIDFGLAKRYRDPATQQHIPYREHMSLTGTARYSSINTHFGIEQSRRDDLEAIGYVLFYFLRGSLPWQGYKMDTREAKYKKIMDKKVSTPVEILGKGFPGVFCTYINYCRSLDFEDRPDYAYPRMLLKDLFFSENFAFDHNYDWEIVAEKKRLEREARFGPSEPQTLESLVLGMDIGNTVTGQPKEGLQKSPPGGDSRQKSVHGGQGKSAAGGRSAAGGKSAFGEQQDEDQRSRLADRQHQRRPSMVVLA